jgi:NhaA family Na+:H+ antiporter
MTLLLVAATLLALAWANSRWAGLYEALWSWHPWPGPDLHFVVNDALMTLFFLTVGLEIRREMQSGSLASLRLATLPLVAALGGIVAPAMIYLAIAREPILRAGWAIPTATDIAFALGVLALLGSRVPPPVRVLLLALAIVDDIVAILIIAFVYSGGIALAGLGVAALGIGALVGLQRAGAGIALWLLLPGAATWWGLLQAGVHPTLAGVAIGLLTPLVDARRGSRPLARIEGALHPWVNWLVLPLFALANAGVAIDAGPGALVTGDAAQLGLAIVLALACGKPLGIVGAALLAVRAGWCELPARLDARGLLVIGLLGGIGFTMSIFIAGLAFPDAHLLGVAKLAVLAASATAALIGLAGGRLLLGAADPR